MAQQQVVKHVEGFQKENTVWHDMQDGTMDEFDRRYDEAVAKAPYGLTFLRVVHAGPPGARLGGFGGAPRDPEDGY